MGTEEILLRDYRDGDLEEMTRVDAVCFAADFRFDQAVMETFTEAANAVAVIAETDGGAMAGFVIAHLGYPEHPGRPGRKAGSVRGYIVTLDVLPEYRRGGLGARLIGEMEHRLAAFGAEWMDLHVFTGNDGAVRFYEQMGYERTGREDGFYGAVGLDAFVYRKALRVGEA